LGSKEVGSDIALNHENFNAHSFDPADVKKSINGKIQTPNCSWN
jgi:hypothetical protein